MLRLAGRLSQPSRKSGLPEMKERPGACDWKWIWPGHQQARSFTGRRRNRSRTGSDQPFSLQRRLAHRQMPQMRAVIAAMLGERAPLAEPSKPRYSVTWKAERLHGHRFSPR